MSLIFERIKTRKLQIGTLLCFVLPPIGILVLFILSVNTLYKNWKGRKQISFSFMSVFFLCLLISTVGAAIQMGNLFLLVGSLMILGYWGLYLRVMEKGSVDNFHDFKWIVIIGGVYNCFIGWMPKWTLENPALKFLTGTLRMGEKADGRLFGSSYNSNFTMYLLLLAIAFLLAEILTNIRKKNVRCLSWQILLLLVLSYGVIATGSRAGYTVMFVIYLLFFFRLNKVLFIMVAAVLLIEIKNVFAFMPRKDLVTFSAQFRQKIWANSIEIWHQHFLFGTTPLGFQGQYQKFFNDDMVHAHNIFIGFFAEYGLLGGIAFLVLLCTFIYKSVPLFFYKENTQGLLHYFLLSLPIIVFTGILDEPTFSPQIALPTIILLGYWNKYVGKFAFSFHTLPIVKLKKQQKGDSGYPDMPYNSKRID